MRAGQKKSSRFIGMTFNDCLPYKNFELKFSYFFIVSATGGLVIVSATGGLVIVSVAGGVTVSTGLTASVLVSVAASLQETITTEAIAIIAKNFFMF
jgi:hypothetical protein